MNNFFRRFAFVIALAMPFSAGASQIVIEVLDGGDSPATLGGYSMTEFSPTSTPGSGCGPYNDGVFSVDAPNGGQVDFQSQDGSPLCMSVQDPDWWEWDHGNVFTTDVSWVELILPTDTHAFSAFVGANMTGRGWIEGVDASGDTTREYFGGNTGIEFGDGETPGFGVYATGSCSTITRIIIEPFEWGTGNFAINQGACTAVPEPGSLMLFGLGLLGLAFTRGLQLKRQKV